MAKSRVILRVLLVLTLWAGSWPAYAAPQPSAGPEHGTIADEDWKVAKGEHVDLYFTANSPAAEDIAELKALAEQDFARIANLLHQFSAAKVRIYLFPDELKMPGQGGMHANADKRLVYVLYNDDAKRNSPIHGGQRDDMLGALGTLMLDGINNHPDVLAGAGMILYMVFAVSGREPPMKLAQEAMAEGKFVPLQSLDLRYKKDEQVRVSGVKGLELVAFTKYMIETYGLDRFMWLFKETKVGEFDAALRTAVGKSLADVEQDFRGYLKNYVIVTPPKKRERAGHDY